MRYVRKIGLFATLTAALALSPRTARPEPPQREEQASTRPAECGLRMTPRIARAMARYYVADEVETLVFLTDEQASKLSEAVARRTMQITRDHHDALRGFCERALELLMEGDGKFTPEMGRAFAQGHDTVLPLAHEFLKGVAEDARPILTPDQLKTLEIKLGRDGAELKQLEGKMRRWAAGGAKDREEIDDFDPSDGEPPPPEKRDVLRDSRRRAEYRAHRELQQIGPGGWATFLARSKLFLKLDDAQSAKADEVLARYRQQADAVMTPEWRHRMLANRIQCGLYQNLGEKVPTAPLLYHLDREFSQATAPITELGRKFREEIFALATDAQLGAALARISTTAAQHGLTMDKTDAKTLHLARE